MISKVGKWLVAEKNKEDAISLMCLFGISREYAEQEVSRERFWGDFANFVWGRFYDEQEGHSKK